MRVGDVPVKNYREFAAELAASPDKPLLITVRRPVKRQRGRRRNRRCRAGRRAQELTFEVPAQPLRQFGLVMKMGPITAVQDDSPADNAGLKAGDVIETVDGKPIGDGGDAREAGMPMTLPDYLRRAATRRRAKWSSRCDGRPMSEDGCASSVNDPRDAACAARSISLPARAAGYADGGRRSRHCLSHRERSACGGAVGAGRGGRHCGRRHDRSQPSSSIPTDDDGETSRSRMPIEFGAG